MHRMHNMVGMVWTGVTKGRRNVASLRWYLGCRFVGGRIVGGRLVGCIGL